jgi:hypothetical protein
MPPRNLGRARPDARLHEKRVPGATRSKRLDETTGEMSRQTIIRRTTTHACDRFSARVLIAAVGFEKLSPR